MEFKQITDIRECERLWDKFSPKQSVWDLWDMAYSFHKGYKAKPLFVLRLDDKKEIGILHLQQEEGKEEEWFDFFGGNYPERRTFYIKDKKLIKDFLDQAPEGTSLDYIDPTEKEFIKGTEESDIAYSLNLEKYGHDIENYFQTFNKKHRKNLRYDLRQLEKLDYKLVWNVKGHLDRLAELNKIRFKEESNFKEPEFYDSMQLLLESAEKLGILHLLSIKINKKIESSQTALFYNNVYYVLTGGSNPDIKNLGKLLIVEHIKNAIRLKAKMIDFMSTESGWKKLWNLEETLLYKYEK